MTAWSQTFLTFREFSIVQCTEERAPSSAVSVPTEPGMERQLEITVMLFHDEFNVVSKLQRQFSCLKTSKDR